MKCTMIFTVAVVLGLAIVSGARFQNPEHPPVTARASRPATGDPFAAAGVARNLPGSGTWLNEVRQAQQQKASPDADTAEFTTSANQPMIPGEYNGDVRKLPRARAKKENELDLDGPASTRELTRASKAAGGANNIADAPNNVSLASMPSPIQSFAGMSLADSCGGSNCGIGHPSDANGDVGLNHYIESVNEGLAIYNKSGTLLAAFSEDSLWSNAGTGTPCDNNSHGDPVVIYDQFADRWIITNFAFGFDSVGFPDSPFYQCFAVSKTSDPVSGGWWFYPLRTDNGTSNQPPARTLNDYPKFGNWNDGCLYMSANEFSFPSGQYIGTLFASVNRSDMESGSPLTSSVGFIANSSSPFSLLPSNIAGTTNSDSLPAAGTPDYFVSQSMETFSYEVRKFTPGTSPKICGGGGTLGPPTKVNETVFDSPDDVPQPNANALQSLGERMMQKAQYRKTGASESLWIAHSVQSSPGTTIRPQWAQIDVTGGTVRTVPVQQQIYAPDTTVNRWVPSIAADHDGNVALGYNISNASTFPSIAYSGRLRTDPLNQMSQGETLLVAGSGSQRNSCNGSPCTRWGDYSSLSIDPTDDCTFWFVTQYYDSQANGDSGNWQTRIGSFKFPSCGGNVVSHTLTIGSTNPGTGVAITVSPDDNSDSGSGTTQFTRTFTHGTSVNLTAVTVVSGNVFQKWQRDGADWSTNASTSVTMDGNHTMTAIFVTPTTRSLIVTSSNPGNGVSVTVSPNDNNGAGSAATQFTRTYNDNIVVNLTAPTTAGGNNFQKWMRDGVDWATTAATTVTMDVNHTMTAVYVTPSPLTIIVQTNPAGRSFTVDGASFSSTQTFTWTPGSTHTIATTSIQDGGAGTQFAWASWSDSGTINHSVTPASATTYTANFNTQYMLTINVGPGGTVRPVSGFVNSGQTVNISATPQADFSFGGWTGTGTGSFTGIFKTATITMSSPVTETATLGGRDTTLQFSGASYSVNESMGFFNVTVTRVGTESSAPFVAYATSDGTAKEGRDYVAAQGVLTFAKGETSKTFPVLIIDNGFVDGPRTVNLNLTNIAGAFLGTTSSAVLTINDNDSSNGTNPVDDPHAFVQFNYYDFLARYPDSSGWDFWTNEITKCGTDTACGEVARVNTSGAFFLSIEFQQTGYLVERMYKVAYGDASGNSTNGGAHQLSVPVVRFADFLRDTELIGRGLVVLQTGWEQLLENNKQVYANAFVRTDRFTQAFPTSLTPAEFIDHLNQNAGNVLSASERTTAINLFIGAADTNNLTARAQAVRQIAEDPDLVAAEKNRAFVLAQYFGYLRRDPNGAPDIDYTGYDFWLTKLNQFNGDYVGAQMVKGFISSSEYRQRFGP